MVNFPIDRLIERDIADWQSKFADRLAARAFGDAEGVEEGQRGTAIRAARRALSGKGDARAVIDSFGDTVPMAVLPLVRAVLARTSMASSRESRAASTSEDISRTIAGSRLSIIDDEDALFVVLELAGEMTSSPPVRLTILSRYGAVHVLDLPAPINGAIQLGISASSLEYASIRKALSDPETSIYLA